MVLSFNGALKLYMFHCPYAFKLRQIDKIYPQKSTSQEETEEVEQSTRQFGIEQHDLVAKYITGEVEAFDYVTDTIEHLKNTDNTVVVEQTKYLSLDLEPLARRPESGTFISYRPDAVEYGDGFGKLYDFKFGSIDYGSVIYTAETEFFLFCESLRNPDIGEWEIDIHFPVSATSLPKQKYNVHRLSTLQTTWIMRLEQIMNDKFYIPKPSRTHCHYCPLRREEHGGDGVCEHSVE
jgi:hypothetical protein